MGDDLDADMVGPLHCLSPAERAHIETRLAARRAELIEHAERTYLRAIISDLEADLVEEKTVERAVKRVWASRWNERAFDERAYYGIDHRRAFIGIAVHPTALLERANGVAVTHLIVDSDSPVYQLNSQVGDESVVRPEDPRAVAEALRFGRSGTPPRVTNVVVDVYSSLVPSGTRVWSDADLDTLGSLLFLVHDHFAANDYTHLVPVSIDIEFADASTRRASSPVGGEAVHALVGYLAVVAPKRPVMHMNSRGTWTTGLRYAGSLLLVARVRSLHVRGADARSTRSEHLANGFPPKLRLRGALGLDARHELHRPPRV